MCLKRNLTAVSPLISYGDVTPKTHVGRVVGAICAVTGTLVIALPVPIVSENFSLFYKQERRRRMVQERRAALERAHMEGKVMDYEGQREEKAAAYIQERFRGRGTVRRSNNNLRINNEIEHQYRRESYGGRRVRPRGSEDHSIQSDQPPYYKRKVRLDRQSDGLVNAGFIRSEPASVDNSPSRRKPSQEPAPASLEHSPSRRRHGHHHRHHHGPGHQEHGR